MMFCHLLMDDHTNNNTKLIYYADLMRTRKSRKFAYLQDASDYLVYIKII